MRSIAFITIGCKLNQFETEQMRELAAREGYHGPPAGAPADIYVINTCTVTSRSDYRSRQAVRRAVRSNPDALVVVTGCYAQRSAGELAAIAGVDFVLGNAQKDEIAGYLSEAKRRQATVRVTAVDSTETIPAGARLRAFGSYTRAFVKIQDGCDNRCAYCAVPLARGNSRSKAPGRVVEEIEMLADSGFKELVLTGVHLGSYGRDLSLPASLVDLLVTVAGISGLKRIRLSSIEPTDLTDALLDLVADPGMRICPHLHVPLQSGDDRILRSMGRPYTAASYARLINRIAARVPRCGIGADVMVGFPGEDQPAFSRTRDLIKDLPVTYLHVFSFSRRAGTTASGMKGQVDPAVKKRRSRILRELGRRVSFEFRRALVGETLEVLTLGSAAGPACAGLSGNYVRVRLEEAAPANRILSCRVTALTETGVAATLARRVRT